MLQMQEIACRALTGGPGVVSTPTGALVLAAIVLLVTGAAGGVRIAGARKKLADPASEPIELARADRGAHRERTPRQEYLGGLVMVVFGAGMAALLVWSAFRGG